jgi:hypothetical protein
MNLKLTVVRGWWRAFSLQGNIHHLKINLLLLLSWLPYFDGGVMALMLKNASLS